MKFPSKKVEDFVKECESDGYPLPTPKLWKMRQLTHPEIEELTKLETEWLQLYCENAALKEGLTGRLKSDMIKATMGQYYQWTTDPKPQDIPLNSTRIIMTGLLTKPISGEEAEKLEEEENEGLKK